jgi:hypothetical protein
MDAYFLKDEKTAPQRLNADLDEYWAKKDDVPAAEEAAAAPAADADAAPAAEEAA